MQPSRLQKFFSNPGGTILRWSAAWEKRFLPEHVWQSDMLTLWRERVLFVSCFIAVVGGPVVLIPGLVLAYVEGRWGVIILDIFAYLMAVAVLLGRRIPLNIRAWCVCVLLAILGIVLLVLLGSVGAGYIWLFGASVMAGALIGLRAAFISLLLNVATLLAVGLFIAFGHPSWLVDPTNAVERWLIISLSFILLNAFVTVTTAMMLSGLQNALSKEQDLSKSLKQSEERFRTAFHTNPDALAISGLTDGRYVDVNDGFTKMFGYERTDVIGHTAQELKIWESSAQRRELVKALLEKKIVNNLEVNLLTKDGVAKKVIISASVFDYQGTAHILSMTKDVTTIKETERQLQQAQKMEAVGILAGGIAHDFNNILQMISGYTQLLLLEKSETDPDQAKLAEIDKAVGHAAQLVRQLLAFSRKAESYIVVLDLNKEIISVRKIFERTLPKMIDINLHLGRDLAPVKADPVQIEQILLNLGTNAADAMPDGGILLIETENITLAGDFLDRHIGIRSGDYVLLSISDTGEGMEKSVVDHIFEPFFTTKKFGKGTGLGLASVYGIVKSYDGFISCYSEVGQGTIFKIYLPAAASETLPEAKKVAADLPARGTEVVLLVDDEESIRTFAAEVLQRYGYRVLTTASGEEALEVIMRKGAEIALVILDLGMPGMGGHKCLQEIKKDDPAMKVLIASGYAMSGPVQKSLEAGAAGYIGKPYQISKLLQKVREILDADR